MKNISITLLILLTTSKLFGQPPVVAKLQAKPVALVGGMAHIGNGQIIGNSVILFENGKITEVAEAGRTTPDPARYEVIDITGKHIYPGLIAPNSRIGLDEVGSVKATRDNSETGVVNASVRSLVSYNTDSELIPVTRSNGVLLAQVAPEGAVVSGTSSVVQFDAWNWEDAAYRKDDGLFVNWPDYFSRGNRFAEGAGPAKKNEARAAVLQELDRTLTDGLAYSQIRNPVPVNLKLEAMRGLYDGRKTLFIRADYAKEIIEGVQFARQHNVKKVVVVGATDAWMVVDFLKENNVPVILNALHRLPTREEEDVDMPYKLPALLHKAGVLVGLAYGDQPMQLRNLPFVAGNAAGYGLTREEALMLVTSNNARILGIDGRTGTLAVGKDANIVVSTGDLLDMRFSDVTHAFISGRQISLDNKHKRLNNRFSAKYGF